ncbi:hypothetical protein [Hymenobacter crusticola]|uniref:Uncharacterized protein n=1 Tax=Hymenobacter crusticola TaxID=1770526 RepID=A0A243WC17_9BACT|nr:hypothetical protein [Hymenobacter crusticola]OUJ73180.1 hypothetical protein BXP70_15250 [Hymenobacter crusticola]
MLSTLTYTALPSQEKLQAICKAVAVLDALNSPEYEYRYYSYNKGWAEGEEVFEMQDGEGDQMLILFRAEGCVINGYASDYEESDKNQLTRGLPDVFDEFIFGEPVNSIGTTFCLWYTPAHKWQIGQLETDEDGSENFLDIFDGNPHTYIEWASEYYDEDQDRPAPSLDAVTSIYQGKPLTKDLALAIVPHVEDWQQLERDLQEIGYPYDFN